MEATLKHYPKLFLKLKQRLKRLIKKNNIRIQRKKFKTNVGRAWADENIIKIPIISDIESVYVILHEIGHVILRHVEECLKPLYIQELEAEKYALSILRKWNIHKEFYRDYVLIQKRTQRYIRWNILHTIQRSLYTDNILKLKNIHKTALYYSKISKYQALSNSVQLTKKRKAVK